MEEEGGGERGGPGKNTKDFPVPVLFPTVLLLPLPIVEPRKEISYFIQLNFLFHKNQIYDHTSNDGLLNAGQNTPRS